VILPQHSQFLAGNVTGIPRKYLLESAY